MSFKGILSFKGIFRDPNNIFLWHESEDKNKKNKQKNKQTNKQTKNKKKKNLFPKF